MAEPRDPGIFERFRDYAPNNYILALIAFALFGKAEDEWVNEKERSEDEYDKCLELALSDHFPGNIVQAGTMTSRVKATPPCGCIIENSIDSDQLPGCVIGSFSDRLLHS